MTTLSFRWIKAWISLDGFIRHDRRGAIRAETSEYSDCRRDPAVRADYNVVGIRAGEKLRSLIPLEESCKAVDFGDYYIIQPAFNWWNTEALEEKLKTKQSSTNKMEPFEYASNTNTWWLNSDELIEFIEPIQAA